MTAPRFSVITASYNASATIGALAQSLESQTFRDFEWVVQDGASPDSTLDVLRGYGRTNLELETRPDAGIYDAFNAAVARARGEYLLFVGADDVLADPEVLADANRHLEANHDPDIVLANAGYPDGSTFASRLSRLTLVVNTVHHQGAIYSSRAMKGFRYDTTVSIVADYDLTLTAYLENWRRSQWARSICICGQDGISRTSAEVEIYKQLHQVRSRHIGRARSRVLQALGLANVARRSIERGSRGAVSWVRERMKPNVGRQAT